MRCKRFEKLVERFKAHAPEMPHWPVIEDVNRKVAGEVILRFEHPISVHLQNRSLKDLGYYVTFRISYT